MSAELNIRLQNAVTATVFTADASSVWNTVAVTELL
jgi:hypothetical protein